MKRPLLRSDQSGMVSILVTMIIMVILSLVVIGFAQVSRREQRQALDRQLSTQAFYAAETGINDAVRAIQAGYNTEKTTCGPDASGLLSSSQVNNVLDANAGVEYTCLLINTAPSTLTYSSIDTDQSTVIPVQPSGGTLQRLLFSWQDKSSTSSFTGCPTPSNGQYTLPAAASWPSNCNAGIIRIDLVPRDPAMSRAGLTSRTLTAFLYPQAGSNSPATYNHNVSSPNKGAIIPGNCNTASTPMKCNVSINLSGASGVSGYYLRVRSIYRSNTMSLNGYIAGDQQVALVGAQAVVDSTGKANDVLRRLSVRVPLSNLGNGVPDFAIKTTDSLCKRFGIAPNVAPVSPSNDPACQID